MDFHSLVIGLGRINLVSVESVSHPVEGVERELPMDYPMVRVHFEVDWGLGFVHILELLLVVGVETVEINNPLEEVYSEGVELKAVAEKAQGYMDAVEVGEANLEPEIEFPMVR